MATQTVLFTGTTGMTPVTVDVLDADAGTSFATAVVATETTGQYSFSLTDSAGTYRVNIKLSGSQIGVLFVKTLNTASTFYCMAERWMTTSPTAVDVRQEVDSNSTQLAAIVADTNELQTNQGNWLTADVSDLPTNAEFAARTLVAADYFNASTDVVTLHSDYDAAKTAASQASVTAIDDFVDTEVTAIKAVTDKLDTAMEFDVSVYRFTTNALEQAPAGGSGLDAAGVRSAIGMATANLDTQLSLLPSSTTDAVWDSDRSNWIVVNSMGLHLANIEPVTPTEVDTKIAALKTDLNTDHGGGSWATADVSALASQASVNDIPTNAELATALAAADDAVLAAMGTPMQAGSTVVLTDASLTTAKLGAFALAKGTNITGFNDLSSAQVNTEADAALADVGLTSTITGRIDAAVSTRASQTSLDTLDDFVDTEVAAIKAVTDKVDTMVVLDGAVYQYTVNAVELAPGGGTTNVSVYPLNASMPLKTKGSVLTFYKNEAGEVIGPITVTTRDGSVITPVDLSGMTLEVRFVDYEGTEILTVLNADITVSGADSNQFDFVVTTALTGTVTEEHEDQWHYWSLRDVTGGDDNVLVAGRARVLLA